VTPLDRICRLPTDFHRGSKSAHQLVHEAGIERSSLSAASVASVLRSNPTLVDEWLRWSEDQRSTSGYYFLEEQGQYVVGRHPGGEFAAFDDRIAACAEFIVKWVGLT
jgi:hypothetical protein